MPRAHDRTERRRRSLRVRRAVAAVAVVGLAGVATSCGGGGSSDAAVRVEVGAPQESPSALLARASETTGAVDTGRMRATYTLQGTNGGRAIDGSFTAEGSFSATGRRAEMTVDMSPMLEQFAATGQDVPSTFTMREIVDGTTMYMSIDSDAPSGFGFGNGRWMKLDLADAAGGQGGLGGALGGIPGVGSGVGAGPQGFLESLKGAGASVSQTGTDTVDGVAVSVYEGTIDPAQAVQSAAPDKADEVRQALEQVGMGTIPFTAWVDDQGIVRRFRMDLAMATGAEAMTMSMVVDLYDLGAPVTITPPPPDQVMDLGQLASMFGGGGSHTA